MGFPIIRKSLLPGLCYVEDALLKLKIWEREDLPPAWIVPPIL